MSSDTDMKPVMPSGSNNIERYTPAWIFEGLNTKFDLDPCAGPEWTPSKRWCEHNYTDLGLLRPWGGLVWLNPPWKRGEKRKWIDKLKSHGNGIALVRGGVDSKWLHENPPDALFLFSKRVGYLMDDGTLGPTRVRKSFGGFEPSMLLAYGDQAVEILRHCSLNGLFFQKKEEPPRAVTGSSNTPNLDEL